MSKRTLLRGKPYTPSENSDIRKTWRAAGWKPINPVPKTSPIHYERRAFQA